jgi:hypothetical protein
VASLPARSVGGRYSNLYGLPVRASLTGAVTGAVHKPARVAEG